MLIELLMEHIYIAMLLGFGSTLAVGALLDYTENYVFATILAAFVGYATFRMIGPIGISPVWVAVGYVGVGIFWTIARWYFFVKKRYNEIVSVKNAYCEKHGLEKGYFREIPTNDKAKEHHEKLCREIVGRPHSYANMQELIHRYKPLVSYNRGRVIAWGIYWPASMLIFILADLGSIVSSYIYELTAGVLQKISDSIFSGSV